MSTERKEEPMENRMGARKPLRIQFSLRSLVLMMLVLGVGGGLWGPRLYEKLRDALRPTPATTYPTFQLPVPAQTEPPVHDGYYESGETPLR